MKQRDYRGNNFPRGWTLVRLSDISRKITDGTHHTPTYVSQGVPFISVKDITANAIRFEKCKYISEEEHLALIKRCHPEPLDVLITKSGTIGRTAIVKDSQPFSLFVSVALIKPFKELSSNFIKYALDNYIGNLDIQQSVKGGVIKNLHIEDLKEIHIPFPPLPEQHCIVSKVEELFTKLDAGVDELRKAKARLKRYRQVVLQLAFDGELTREWRVKHPESGGKITEFLENHERNSKSDKGKYSKSLNLDHPDLPRMPKGWAYSRIESFLDHDRKGIKTGPFGTSLKKSDHQATGIPVIGIENIGKCKFIQGSKIHISNQKYSELSSFSVMAGDILISRSGTVGEICVAPTGLGASIISTNLMRVALDHSVVNPMFFAYLFQGDNFVRKQIRELCKGSTRDFLNQGILSSIIYKVPSLSEQEQIIEKIEFHFSVIDNLEHSLERNANKAKALRQSILKTAFEGKLIPQDPRDEPAEKLLERIRGSVNKTVQSRRRRKSNGDAPNGK
jgi:type I restriction enzyme S subunit